MLVLKFPHSRKGKYNEQYIRITDLETGEQIKILPEDGGNTTSIGVVASKRYKVERRFIIDKVQEAYEEVTKLQSQEED